MKPRRPLLRWHGGKYRLASWIIGNMPEHRTYVEPFGGAGSVLLCKSRSYAEVWNDINDDVYNLFWVLREDYAALVEVLRLTPFSRREFEISYFSHPNPIERARRLVVRSFMGFGADSAANVKRPTGFRSNSNRSGTTPAHDWVSYETHLHQLADRIRGVVLECKDAFEVMKTHDSPDTVHYVDPPYVDPPYVAETRKRFGAYLHEFTEHEKLLGFLKGLKGTVLLSGYETELYANELRDWNRIERAALADGAQKRMEVLWIKQAI